ncbi:molybdopterin-binding oxidoreductase [Caulobacter sp. RHG1]|uniref:molybdopterin-binding oxidoreductase n=1 Tax=Caulobacter sp. (strain RHG1) TaxID=2545762 RepID=UPI001551B1E8|nr:molybdopterin-binding oxidoreductase [Caulobacter sp. RHG1]NQE65169.1 hypothetical protein [Caulobacter sp. RHG1]
MRLLSSLVALALLASPVAAQTLVLTGPAGQSVTLSAADIAALPRQTVTFAGHGESHVYEGPLLIDVLAKAGAPTGQALRGPALANVVLVEAGDGYKVAFGLAEADPGTRANRMILADKADGAPMGEGQGPFRLIVEGDLRPARGARMVSAIKVINLGGGSVGAPAHKH